jgi:hypothetical protein
MADTCHFNIVEPFPFGIGARAPSQYQRRWLQTGSFSPQLFATRWIQYLFNTDICRPAQIEI